MQEPFIDTILSSVDGLNQAIGERHYQEVTTPAYIASASTAPIILEYLKDEFRSFEKSLNADEEIGMIITHVGRSDEILVYDVRSLGASLVRVRGMLNGNLVSYVVHVSQLNFLLIPVKKPDPQARRRMIGFGSVE